MLGISCNVWTILVDPDMAISFDNADALYLEISAQLLLNLLNTQIITENIFMSNFVFAKFDAFREHIIDEGNDQLTSG